MSSYYYTNFTNSKTKRDYETQRKQSRKQLCANTAKIPGKGLESLDG